MDTHAYFTTVNRTKGRLKRLPFARIKNAVLGKTYTLELVFTTPTESRSLNLQYRGKKKPANVLSFPLSRTKGQIFICPHEAQKQSASYGLTTDMFIGYLFIHGLLHLEGYRHGSTMEDEERRLCAKFLWKK